MVDHDDHVHPSTHAPTPNPPNPQATSANYFIKRDQGRLAMAYLRFLAQTRPLKAIELVVNSLFPLAPVREVLA